jgi:hypothetical protein
LQSAVRAAGAVVGGDVSIAPWPEPQHRHVVETVEKGNENVALPYQRPPPPFQTLRAIRFEHSSHGP